MYVCDLEDCYHNEVDTCERMIISEKDYAKGKKWLNERMRYVGSISLVYEKVDETNEANGKCILVYGEMDVSNGLVRIMMWKHGKMEKWLGVEKVRERERESGMCHPHMCK